MAFGSLPLELNEHIATYLDNDKDLCSYIRTCRDTHNAVHSNRYGVWRHFYARKYDLPAGKAGKKLMVEYIVRQSYSSPAKSHILRKHSNNVARLDYVVKASNILDVVLFKVLRSDHKSRLLQTLQLTLTHCALDLSIRSEIKGFGYSQQAVYAHPRDMPMVLDKNWSLNVEYLLHIVNFFKYHMKTETENTLYPLLCDLDTSERPRAWDCPLTQGPGIRPLGPQWKGSYAYLPKFEDIAEIRYATAAGVELECPIPDAIDYDEGFQTLEMDFSPTVNSTPWPSAFEQHLHALPPRALRDRLRQEQELASRNQEKPSTLRRSGRTPPQRGQADGSAPLPNPPLVPTISICERFKSFPTPSPSTKRSKQESKSDPGPQPRKDYLQFNGSGKDLGPYFCTGITHNLPPQSGIPGWQRVCMMKYFVDDASSSADSAPSTPSSGVFSTTSSSSTSSTSSSAASPPPPPTNAQKSLKTHTPFGFSDHSSSDYDDALFVLDDQCWCYEGIALPGGKIIVGRWWHPLDANAFTAMGPFIFWNVDQSS